jgi:hypothetical protein
MWKAKFFLVTSSKIKFSQRNCIEPKEQIYSGAPGSARPCKVQTHIGGHAWARKGARVHLGTQPNAHQTKLAGDMFRHVAQYPGHMCLEMSQNQLHSCFSLHSSRSYPLWIKHKCAAWFILELGLAKNRDAVKGYRFSSILNFTGQFLSLRAYYCTCRENRKMEGFGP